MAKHENALKQGKGTTRDTSMAAVTAAAKAAGHGKGTTTDSNSAAKSKLKSKK